MYIYFILFGENALIVRKIETCYLWKMYNITFVFESIITNRSSAGDCLYPHSPLAWDLWKIPQCTRIVQTYPCPFNSRQAVYGLWVISGPLNRIRDRDYKEGKYSLPRRKNNYPNLEVNIIIPWSSNGNIIVRILSHISCMQTKGHLLIILTFICYEHYICCNN